MRRFFVIFVSCLLSLAALGETIPPQPPEYFTDYANVVSPQLALQLSKQLAEFERQSSDQILVAIYPKMDSDSDIADYCTRVVRSWKERPGQKDKSNGAVLFVFIQDHKWYLATGYGLEAVLPDGLVKTMMDEDLVARFRNQDFGGGLTAAVNDIIAAAKGEYKGTGHTIHDRKQASGDRLRSGFIIFIVIVFIVLRMVLGSRRRYGWVMGPGGWGGGGGGGGGAGGSW